MDKTIKISYYNNGVGETKDCNLLVELLKDDFKVNKLTQGQASTCLLAKQYINPNKSLFIASCDYETIYSEKK